MSHRFDSSGSPSVQINATLEAPCVVYCGVFATTDVVSAYEIRTQELVFYAVGFDASIAISSFSPNSVNDIYCMTTTLDGVFEMSLASILDTRYTVVIPCCRSDLSVDVSSKYIPESQYLQNSMLVNFELDSPVANEVHMNIDVVPLSFFLGNDTVTLRRNLLVNEAVDDCANGVVVDPTFISMTSSSSLEELGHQIRIASLCPGTFLINISAVELDLNNREKPLPVVFPNQNMIEIFPLNTSTYEFVAPSLVTAVFVSDGQEIELRFDSSTNKAGLGGIFFFCNRTAEFSGASATLCYWKSSTRMRIQQAQELLLGDNITLIDGVVASEYAANAYAGTVTRSLGSALTTLPAVLVSSPSRISSCAQFSLDLSASTGSGGRSWKSVSVVVKTGRSPSTGAGAPVNFNVSHINSFFADIFVVSPITSLPSGYLLPGQIYIFQITLCNFLDKCAHRDHRLEVGALPIPVVYMQGDEYRTILRTESVRFKAAPVHECNGTALLPSEFKTQFSPVYTWEFFNMYDQSAPVLTVTRVNRFSSTLTLSPYTLNSDNEYRVTVSLAITFEGEIHVSQHTCFLSVLKGPLRAILSTSGFVSIRYGEYLLLNASSSFDSNSNDDSEVSAVSVAWRCTSLDSSQFTAGCGSAVLEDASQMSLVVNSTKGGYVGAFYRVELIVSPVDATDTRSSSAVVDVYIEADCCSKLSVPPMGLVNTQEVVSVEGLIVTSLNGVSEWSLLESALDLSSIVMAPLEMNIFTFYPISTTISANLVISPNTLAPGTSYVFQLVYNSHDGHDFRSASVTITTNDIPRSGIFSVSPHSGVELKDKFFLSASQWTDDQVPLLYHFGHYAESGDAVTLKAKDEDSSVEAVLPRGYPLTENASLTLDCFLEVYDKLGAYAIRSQRVVVNASALNVSVLDSLYDLLANETESSEEEAVIEEVRDVLVPVVVIVTNCSAAPDCESLNRDNCSDVEHTCGTCFAGNYLGEAGHANTFCYNNTISEEGVQHCFEDASCGSFRECVAYTCTRISQPCTATCLLNGNCTYRNDTTGLAMDGCFVDDVGCSPVCDCNSGFNGPECDIPGTSITSFCVFHYVCRAWLHLTLYLRVLFCRCGARRISDPGGGYHVSICRGRASCHGQPG